MRRREEESKSKKVQRGKCLGRRRVLKLIASWEGMRGGSNRVRGVFFVQVIREQGKREVGRRSRRIGCVAFACSVAPVVLFGLCRDLVA